LSWKKYFKAPNTGGGLSPINGGGAAQQNFKFQNYGSLLPEVYMGHPNRIERYNQFESMDLDSEVNSALDIIGEFCTQPNEQNGLAFDIHYHDKPTETEIGIIKKQLQAWCSLNQFDRRTFKMFRNVLKYGDQVFVRDPETFKLMWVDMSNLLKIIVNESDGKVPEQYVIRNINPNLENMSVTQVSAENLYYSQPNTAGSGASAYNTPNSPFSNNSRFMHGIREITLDAENILHLSLTEGLDGTWPFGNSILENIFKVYKQKELLEDCIVIYRVQRAPERRVFKIDTGNMPSHMAMAFVERVKNEIHQRRIPNSNGGQSFMDSTYNPMCLDLTTRIPLLDGRTLPLATIIDEFDAGKENWVYSCDPITGEVMPGVIDWAGITKRDAAVIKLTLDNGEELICTPDHKIPVLGKGFVAARDLTTTDSLIAYNTQDKKISNKSSEYQQVWDHKSKSWVWTHRMVGEFFRKLSKHQEFTYLEENISKTKAVIHHKDSDRYNNDPSNLAYMNKADHILYHAAQKKKFWDEMTPEYRARMTGKISATVKDNWNNLTPRARQVALDNIRSAQKKAIWMRQHDPTTMANYKKNAGASRRGYIQKNPACKQQLLKNLENRVFLQNQHINLTQEMLGVVVNIVKSNSTNKNQVLDICDHHTELLSLVKQANPIIDGVQCKIDFSKWGYSKMDRLLNQFGYKNWKTFVKNVDLYNHKIVSIETVESRDVGTITVDGKERWHAHHTFAIESGIFVKNSINEDYFFPQTADGRGSSVDILQGGQNLGEIDDLKFFTNKMFRGLRIPSSYLPTGAEDSAAVHNDGKVATALIQEHRFNQYCMRLQSLICKPLDTEFKAFLMWRGFNLDNTMFELRMNEPQNFAKYRQAEVDTAKISSFSQLEQTPYMSKRFMMKRYLGLSEEEILENNKMWREENTKPEEAAEVDSSLKNVGITSGNMESDMESLTPPEPGPTEIGAEPITATPVAPPPTGTAPTA